MRSASSGETHRRQLLQHLLRQDRERENRELRQQRGDRALHPARPFSAGCENRALHPSRPFSAGCEITRFSVAGADGLRRAAGAGAGMGWTTPPAERAPASGFGAAEGSELPGGGEGLDLGWAEEAPAATSLPPRAAATAGGWVERGRGEGDRGQADDGAHPSELLDWDGWAALRSGTAEWDEVRDGADPRQLCAIVLDLVSWVPRSPARPRQGSIAPPAAIAMLLFSLPLFRSKALPKRAWAWCLQAAQAASLRRGSRYQRLYHRGATPTHVFLVLKGGLSLVGAKADDGEPSFVGVGGVCGAECIVSEAPRCQSAVWSAAGGTALAIPRESLEELAIHGALEPSASPELAKVRWRLAELLLADSPIADGLSGVQVLEAAGMMRLVEVSKEAAPHHALYHQGKPALTAFILLHGTVETLVTGSAPTRHTHRQLSSVLLGGEDAFAGRPHAESARVVERGTRLLQFRGSAILPLLRILPGLRESIASIPGSAQVA